MIQHVFSYMCTKVCLVKQTSSPRYKYSEYGSCTGDLEGMRDVENVI